MGSNYIYSRLGGRVAMGMRIPMGIPGMENIFSPVGIPMELQQVSNGKWDGNWN